MDRPRRFFIDVICFITLGISLLGCARIGQFAHKRADKAAYGIIAQTQQSALGQSGEFSVDPAQDAITSALLQRVDRLDWDANDFSTPTTTISLDETLALAIANNRDYKSQREALFTQALALTETRRDFGPIYDANASAQVTRTESGNDSDLGPTVERFGSRGFDAGINWLLATGATVGLNFSHQFTRFLTSPHSPASNNALSLSVIQPLLNGAGPLVTQEPLRQAERDMAYAVRSFRRFQQSFLIEVASSYYNLLATQDQLHNARRNYESALLNWRRLKRYAEGGKSTEVEVDQAYQKVLEAEAGLSSSQYGYSAQLDQFKLFLGLPIDLDLGADHRELEQIAQRGLLRPDMTLGSAIECALDNRLDFLTTRDRIDDTRRQLKIAEQNFLPTLNGYIDYTTAKGDDKDRIRLDFRDSTLQSGLDLTLPLDWTVRRNNYRLAQLALQQSERDGDQAHDNLVLEVRNAWRTLDELRTNYRIQQESVQLAERQVRSTSMLLQMGRATARDLLEAQDSLLASRNAATSALVSHTIQRLRFWNAIERLEVDPKGMWYENPANSKQ